jgi:YfiH family protein
VSSTALRWIKPDWPAPTQVRVVSTLRDGGVSTGKYRSLNLAEHVGDRPEAVAENRRLLREVLGLPAEPLWLEQVHGTAVAVHRGTPAQPQADAAVAAVPGRVCAVMTADCLPVVLADRNGRRVAVAHAGWRGLCSGVLEAAVEAIAVPPAELLAWLGPAIGPDAFEVGPEVRDAFLRRTTDSASAFRANARGRYLADLYTLARVALGRAGVDTTYGGGWCTCSEADRFFSYRRDGVTGRMATLAWLA